ncbi:tripartite tricarboxylate transporter substrate binding protein [Pigmentiphaga sp. GD03639]|jgi:tripartite-type tricarboxylate transporter receptor subunit TctC|nr:tripartite tricarboxylate transporter substrate binding protein [Pigmentiphaga sp. GD03639]MDH2238884.1 tripartite tricarboxylate transporter substrate binding protein [Pigmentiphaga sp. GD03639]
MLRPLLASLHIAAAVAILPATANAQSYPSKPVRIIVPAAAGGTSDIVARLLAMKLQESMGKPFIVEYKAGAGTNLGSDYVAKAAPDGYTLLLNGISMATSQVLYPDLPYNPLKDLTPIIEAAAMSNVITVNPQLPVHNLKELIALAKKNPGKYNYGSPGFGSSASLSGQLLEMKTGAKLTHVAYQGNAQATNDHLAGLLEVGFVNLPVALPFVKSGKLRPLAVTSSTRSSLLPDVPTVAEALNIDYELTGWFGLLAPAGTPGDIIAKLHKASAQALADPSSRETIMNAGAEVVGGSSADFARTLRVDTERLTELVKQSGASVNK